MRKILNVNSIKTIYLNYLIYNIGILILFVLNFLFLVNLTSENEYFYMVQFNSLTFGSMFVFSLLGIPFLFEGVLWKPKLYIKMLIFFTLSLLFLPFYCVILFGIIYVSNFTIFYIIEIVFYLFVTLILLKIMIDSLKLIKNMYSEQTVKTIMDIYSKLFNGLSLIMVLITAFLGMAGFETSKNISLYTLLVTFGLIVINIILYIISYSRYAKIFIIDLINGFRV